MMLPNQFNVMPVKDKKPLIAWKDLTERQQTTEEKAAVLANGEAGKIGIVTGPVSRLFVLDIDGPEGEKSIEQYHIPKTWSVKTPHGRHFYFRWIPELDSFTTTKAGVLDGIDVRGTGGYVVWYGWDTAPHLAPLAAPPRWLIELLSRKDKREVTTGMLGTLSAIKPGNRNQSFASLAGGLRARGFGVDEMYNLLEAKAKECDFPLNELRMVCNSIGRYKQGETPVVTVESTGESVEAFLAESEPVKWICKPFIAEQSIGIVGGLPESRKSWILVDLAVECAKGGGLWMNKFPVKGARVLLIDQERSKSEVQRRLKAVLVGKGVSASSISSTLFVRCGTSTRIDQNQSYDSLRAEIAEIKPDLILIDSFATFHTKEESNRMEIQQVMERIKQIRNDFKCAVILIHHATKQSFQNKANGAEPSYLDLAGNVAIPAAAEMCLGIVKHDDEASFVHHTKCTQGTKMAPFLVKVRDVKPDGSSIVVEAY